MLQLSWLNRLALAAPAAAADPRLQLLQLFSRQLLNGSPAGPSAGLHLKQQLAKLAAGSTDVVVGPCGQPLCWHLGSSSSYANRQQQQGQAAAPRPVTHLELSLLLQAVLGADRGVRKGADRGSVPD